MVFDVGQGTANLVFLADRRALVFDVGPRNCKVMIDFLSTHQVESIECVVLSHNDADHVAGFEELTKNFWPKIQKVFILEDRDFLSDPLFDLVWDFVKRKRLKNVIRAEVPVLGTPLPVWQTDDGSMRVDLIYPDMVANLNARKRNRPNATSAIARFHYRDKCVVFPGDSNVAAWVRLSKAGGVLPIAPRLLAMPHHGGLLDASPQRVKWLLQQVIQPANVTISAATGNRNGHPRQEYLEYLTEGKVRIFCTQITPERCHKNGDPAMVADGVLVPLHDFSASHSRYRGGSGYVGCAGTIVALLKEGMIEVHRSAEYEQSVNKTASPMCRRDGAP
jgi:hypothetical protein